MLNSNIFYLDVLMLQPCFGPAARPQHVLLLRYFGGASASADFTFHRAAMVLDLHFFARRRKNQIARNVA